VPSQPAAIPRHISLHGEMTKSVMSSCNQGKPTALPQIDAASAKLNGDLNEEERKKLLGLDFQGNSNGKLTTMAQAQGNIVKVAIYHAGMKRLLLELVHQSREHSEGQRIFKEINDLVL